MVNIGKGDELRKVFYLLSCAQNDKTLGEGNV